MGDSDANSSEEGARVGYGVPGYYEDWLVGNTRGFEVLRDHIDQLLENGEDVPIGDDLDCQDFCGLSLRGLSPPSESVENEWLWSVGCLAVILLVGAVLVLGIWKAIELLA